MIYCDKINLMHNNTYKNIFNDLQCIDNKTYYNKDFWAFAYKEDERALNLICKPIKGRIMDSAFSKKFYEYKKDGKTLKTNGVNIESRCYADTYEEAVDGFNRLVKNRIKSLKNEIRRLEDMLIV